MATRTNKSKVTNSDRTAVVSALVEMLDSGLTISQASRRLEIDQRIVKRYYLEWLAEEPPPDREQHRLLQLDELRRMNDRLIGVYASALGEGKPEVAVRALSEMGRNWDRYSRVTVLDQVGGGSGVATIWDVFAAFDAFVEVQREPVGGLIETTGVEVGNELG